MNSVCIDGEKTVFQENDIKWSKGDLSILIQGEENEIYIGKGCQLSNVKIVIVGDSNKIQIGAFCTIKNSKFLMLISANNRKVKLGEKVYIGNAAINLTSHNDKVEIGSDCMFSNEIIIRTEDGHPIYDLETKELLNKGGEVFIGDHCWIGERAYILKGTRLADNTIVGACAVISKRFSQGNIVLAGNPASVVKIGVGWKKENIHDYSPRQNKETP